MKLFTVVFAFWGCVLGQISEQDGERFLEDYEQKIAVLFNENVKATWTYYTNITKNNEDLMIASNLKMSAFDKEVAKNASVFNWQTFTNSTVKRLFEKITNIGFAAVNNTETLQQISRLEAELTGIYSTGSVCITENNCLSLEPGLTDIISNSRDYVDLLNVWKGWRDQTGRKMKQKYTEFADVMNEAIRFSGFKDTGEYWRSWYETPTFEEDVKKLYDELRPLYIQLQAYVRRKLKAKYGAALFPSTGHIPAHILGNMWAQQWGNIYSLVEPYPDAASVDITAKMKDLGYNITHMYRVAEEFFTSIGMEPMPDGFWSKSMLEKPPNRDVVCHASAWDFYDGEDFRIKMCTAVTEKDLLTVHHEMGHVVYFWNYKRQSIVFRKGSNPGNLKMKARVTKYRIFSVTDERIKQCTSVTEDQLLTVHHEMGHVVYFQNYKHLPRRFRGGANPGFHEGMADIVSLSFQTPEHMKAIGLIDEIPADDKSDINFLLRMALDKVAFLPFGYLIDQWRWSVFRGDTPPSNYNKDWWKLRCQYQGISPPVPRTEEDFDAGAKYHIPGNTPYIRYFVSYVVQFQWHKALCEIAGNTRPLHRCDIYRNNNAGEKLREMLRLGSSKPWQDAMEVITGNRTMSAKPLVEYFTPLMDWLKQQNGNDVGWENECPTNIPLPGQVSTAAFIRSSVSLFSVILYLLINISIFIIF